jgi:hypothetical protein
MIPTTAQARPNHALQRTRRKRRGCNRRLSCAGSLSLGRSAPPRADRGDAVGGPYPGGDGGRRLGRLRTGGVAVRDRGARR